MNPSMLPRIRVGELLEPTAYEARREEIRREVPSQRAARSVQVGERLALVFETRATLLHQVQERMRADGTGPETTPAERVSDLLELLPEPGELIARLYVEVFDPSRVQAEGRLLAGLDEAGRVCLLLGSDRRILGEIVRGPGAPVPSFVFTLRFHLDDSDLVLLRDLDRPAQVSVDHPEVRTAVPIPESVRVLLLEDLAAS
jgi:hypothetical protein